MHHEQLTQARERYLHFFNTALHSGQQNAVCPLQGTFVVRAGAGSGKTRVITSRMLHLMLCHEAPASRIIALTFTNKAAREMRERMERFMPGATLPFINTFHAYCMRLLRQWGAVIGLDQFSLLDDADQEKICKKILDKAILPRYVKLTPGKMLGMISHHKNSKLGITDAWFMQLLNEYEREKRLARCLDFDDLLTVCTNLLSKHEAVLASIQSSLAHVLVDEYQDTNSVQHELLQLLTLKRGSQQLAITSLCVVGDEDQSIYAWRGATIDNMLHFSRSFNDVTMVTIEQNYRSAQPILDAANSLIKHNQRRAPKSLWSERLGGASVRVITCASSFQEAAWIVHAVHQFQMLFPGKTCAVLYRSHHISRSIEEALVKAHMTYTIMGGVRFYDRQEIRDLLAYLRCMANPYDRLSLIRALNTPSRGLGSSTQEALLAYWDQEPLADLHTILPLFAQTVPERKRQAIMRVHELISRGNMQSDPHDVLVHLVARTGWNSWLHEQYEQDEAQERFNNVQELIHAAQAAVQRGVITLGDFLEEVALMQEDPRSSSAAIPCVTLMTLHAAKGLEFPLVIICAAEESVLPSGMSLNTPDGIEEERRLMYVGITRAQDCLFISHAHQRAIWGTLASQAPSRFLSELPAHIPRETLALMAPIAIQAHTREWIQQAYYTIPTRRPAPEKSIDNLSTSNPASSARQEDKIELYPGLRVSHDQFGVGTIQDVAVKQEHTIVTVRFTQQTKKLSSTFLRILR